MKILACAAIFAAAALAQETPTERDAARDVLHQMAELEKSIDVSGWVERLSAPNAERDKVTARARQLMDTELLAMADDITKHPEIGFEEKRSVGILVDYLRKHNFDVTVGVANLPTAFVARYKGNHGAPNLGVILEYDALRGTQRRLSRRPAQRAGAGGHRRGGGHGGVPGALARAGQRGGLRDSGRGDDAAGGQDRYVQGGRVQRHGRDRAQPLGERHQPSRAGLRHLLPEYRRREVHVLAARPRTR